jgi:glycosyltransferase involved in cell wall biosynthesis
MSPPPVQVSVVIPTYNRCEDCKRAVSSALEQEPEPLEVLVCDDGSTDETQAELERWQSADHRVRYLRMQGNRGTPAPARNLGIASARAEWVAFLDDDDRWLPGKLALQAPLLADDRNDVVASDAIRSSGGWYFGKDSGIAPRPTRAEIERANPVILSSAVVRRSLLREAGSFEESRAIAGVEDYELWLRLADRGARFVVLEGATIEYRDHDLARLSSARSRTQRALLRVRLRRLLRAPTDRLVLGSAVREIYATVRTSLLQP